MTIQPATTAVLTGQVKQDVDLTKCFWHKFWQVMMQICFPCTSILSSCDM
jgi:hypothetical protein